MQSKKIDLIVFDSEDSLKQSRRSSRIFPNTSKKDESQHSNHYELIEQEMHFLSEKISQLEQQTSQLNVFRNESYCPPFENDKNHALQVVMAIEKKLQIIVKETRRIMKAMGESIETQISSKMDRKYNEKGLHEMQRQYNSSLKLIEEQYRKEVDRLGRQYSQIENKMMVKVIEMEQKLLAKIGQFEKKEKKYVEWIHHLEKQLKQRQMKIKKVIEATLDQPIKKQQQKQLDDEVKSKKKIVVVRQKENIIDTPQKRLTNFINDNSNNSRISRKHKIFENYNKQLSLSRDRDIKLRNSQINFYSQSFVSLKPTKVVNPTSKIFKPNDNQQNSEARTVSFKGSQALKPNIDSLNGEPLWKRGKESRAFGRDSEESSVDSASCARNYSQNVQDSPLKFNPDSKFKPNPNNKQNKALNFKTLHS